MDKKTRDVLSEISSLTRDIEENYPELQKYLDESRSTLPKPYSNDGGATNDLEDYLEELKELVANYDK